MSLAYFPFYPADYEADTSHLTLEEDGAYNRLLRLCWMTPGCSIPDEKAWIMRRLRVDEDTFDRVVSVVVSEFFKRRRGRLYQPRLSDIFQETNASRNRRSKAGQKGGRPSKSLKEKENTESNDKAMLSYTRAFPEPEPNTLEGKPSNDAAASPDPAKVMFDSGVALLSAAGVKHPQARAVIGKWRKAHGTEAVIAAIGRAQREGAVDPVAFITGALRFAAKAAEPRPGDIRVTGDGRRQVFQAGNGWMTEHV